MTPIRIFLLAWMLLLTGCATTTRDALKLPPTSLADRQLQSRVYENVSETQILSAGVGIIQDLGARITESETDLGLVVGEKSAMRPPRGR